jgi:hypothetical protein
MAWWNFLGGPQGPVRARQPTAPAKDLMRGHPTAPGPRDSKTPRVGAQEHVDGRPGRPRLTMDPYSWGPGIPGDTPAGPMQPGTRYEGEDQ